MRLRDLLSPTLGFQRSVSVLYDLDDSQRIRGFIPTDHAEWVISDVLSSLAGAGNRSSMLIGSYGTGKSHLATFIGSLLGKRVSAAEFEAILPRVKDKNLRDTLAKELSETRPYLIVPVMGGTYDVKTSLLKALKRALDRAQLRLTLDSAFSKAVEVVRCWKNEYEDTYSRFEEELRTTAFGCVDDFLQALEDADKVALEWFERVYRKLSSGAEFDQYGDDIVEMYVSVARKLPTLGYRGIFVVYDEFNRVLEQGTRDVLTLKILQDLAEACNRSSDIQNMYLMLISHKTIGQYASNNADNNAEEWLKVEGRFRVYDLTRHPGERYQLMSRVFTKIQQDWRQVLESSGVAFLGADRLRLKGLFKFRLPTYSEQDIDDLVKDCFPLHPVLVYALPLVSNRLAQNERTMFTFMASPDESPVVRMLDRKLAEVEYIYPFQLFDYFETEMRRSSEHDIRTTWIKAANALQQFDRDQVESMILRTIGILSILGNQELTSLEMVEFSLAPKVSHLEFERALANLITKRLVFVGDTESLAISVPVGMDINAELAARMQRMTLEPVFDLQKYGITDYVVPRKFNHRTGMTRYLTPKYVDYRGLLSTLQGASSGLPSGVDGFIVYVFPATEQELANCRKAVLDNSTSEQILVALPSKPVPIREAVLKVRALDEIRHTVKRSRLDDDLENVLAMYFEDALLHLQRTVSRVTTPSPSVEYYWMGKKVDTVASPAQLSDFVSQMMERVFRYTPVVNNELVNRARPTSTSRRALNFVVDAVLRGTARKGARMPSSQEQFMLDTLFIRTGLAPNSEELRPESCSRILEEIDSFLKQAHGKPKALEQLISTLMRPPYGIRAGIVPVFLAAALSGRAKTIVIRDRTGAECLLTASLLEKVTSNPENYSLEVEKWNDYYDLLVSGLADIFDVDLDTTSHKTNEFEIVGDAVFRWFVSLPKISRETKRVDHAAQNLRRAARRITRNPREVILHELPNISGHSPISREGVQRILDCVRRAKAELENVLSVERAVITRITEDLLQNRGVRKGTVLQMAREFIGMHVSKLGMSPDYARFADCVQSQAGSDTEFIEDVAEALTGIPLADWTDETENRFRSTLENILETVMGIETHSSEPQIEISIPDPNNGPPKKYFVARGPVSETAALLQSELEMSISDFGDAVSRTEIKQVLVNILERMLAP